MKAQPARRRLAAGTRLIVRSMEERDIPQCEEIEREVFPTMFPRTSFRSEFRRPISSYLVAAEPEALEKESIAAASPSQNGSLLETVADRGRRLLRSFAGQYQDEPSEFLAGMIGIWYMVDDAHIVTVAVREDFRGKGVGEMLLIEALRQASDRCEGAATLEVRVSNEVARNLYVKYGFREKGIRKGYYSDNREDAVIMTTERLRSDSYRQRLQGLAEAHQKRWGYSRRETFA